MRRLLELQQNDTNINNFLTSQNMHNNFELYQNYYIKKISILFPDIFSNVSEPNDNFNEVLSLINTVCQTVDIDSSLQGPLILGQCMVYASKYRFLLSSLDLIKAELLLTPVLVNGIPLPYHLANIFLELGGPSSIEACSIKHVNIEMHKEICKEAFLQIKKSEGILAKIFNISLGLDIVD
jgi:hypothetical protein